MEKKGNRSVQSSAKGNATELKKNQDVSGGKLWPRKGRRREPPCGAASAKNEPSRKPIPQRNKTVDKRPRPRGCYYSGSGGGKEDAGLEEVDAEVGSVFVQGSKKQSLNHLLNFNYNLYGSKEGNWQGRGSGGKEGRSWLGTQKHHKYNKEQFLQANCRFVVNAVGDYKQYVNNPDALVSWDLIEQVNVQVSDFPSCPICLDEPVAAKMTRCGHIYCWPCILHYLALSDKSWRKCPICYEAVHKQDLRSVVADPHSSFNVGDHITFRLMKRARGCLTAYPADYKIKYHNVLYNVSDSEVRNVYTKLLIANKMEILEIIDRERHELEANILEDDGSERCFLEQALELLVVRENAVKSGFATEDEACCLNAEDDCNLVEEQDELSQHPLKYFYFYQACDGQHIYLNAVNVRMLEHTYGSLENSPAMVTGRIVEKEGGSMTEELRKRLRYLQHLPVTCQFEVAEIQLKPPVVTKETLEEFNDQIEGRKKQRQRRAKEEKRREKRILEEENRKMGKYPSASIQLESHQQFPEFGYEPSGESCRTVSESAHSDESSSEGLQSLVVGSWGSEPDSGMCSRISFAKMLSTKKPEPEQWPGLKKPSCVQEPVTLINVTGPKSSVFAPLRKDSESEDVDQEGYVPVPVFNQSFGDALAIAFEKASLGTNTKKEAKDGVMGSKKKKKGKKGMFASTMADSGK